LRIYVENLHPEVTEEELRKTFQAFGKVTFVKINPDVTQEIPANSGMVGMDARPEARAAIAGLHMNEMKGRVVTVREAGVHSR
jgi:RNA recognition motif-containing protein